MSSSPLSDSMASNSAQPMIGSVAQRSPQKAFAQFAVIAVLSLFVVVIAVPQYLGGWPWATPLKLPATSRTALQSIPEKGLSISGWNTLDQGAIELGNGTWSVQQLSPASNAQLSDTPVSDTQLKAERSSDLLLLLRPQVYGADQPEVEWLDVKGSQQWGTDTYQKLRFELTAASDDAVSNGNQPISITADWFRAWNQEQTYAIAQWYAWPTGGHPSPGRWFWADQRMQWQRRQRLPWVAVSLWIPVEPLSDISSQQALAISVGEGVQRSLMQTVFRDGGDSR